MTEIAKSGARGGTVRDPNVRRRNEFLIMNGEIPNFGLGTWELTGDAGVAAISSALEVGYRHIDTAQSYGSEEAVGQAIAASPIRREDIFVTTKITDANLGRVEDSLRDSLSVMRLDQVDLALIHWPSKNDAVPMDTYLAGLARAQDEGLARMIGVSNFIRKLIDQAIRVLGEGQIAANQVECNPYLQNKALAAHCNDRGITITAYLPIARGKVSGDPVLRAIAERHDATPEQVSLAYLVQRGHVVIPKSANPERQRTNLAASSLVLSEQEMAEISELDCGDRVINPERGPDWD